MKSTVRTAALALTIAALATLSSSSASAFAGVKVHPKPIIVEPDCNPVPLCPMNDPNGCGIYSN